MRRHYFSAWLDPLQATVGRIMYYQNFFFYDRATWLPSKETKKKTLSGSYFMIYCKQRDHERPKSPSKLYHRDQEEITTSESKWSLREKNFELFF